MTQFLDHHESLACSQCKKYLSVYPIKVYEEGDIKCGRCSKSNDGGVVSLYQELTKHFRFKCVNRYDGCRTLLLPSEVPEHEMTCIEKFYSCPRCVTDCQMSSTELISHFQQTHNNWLVTKNHFDLMLCSVVSCEKFFHVHDDVMFVILVRYAPNDKYVYVSAVTLSDVKNVEQQFILSTETIPFGLRTKKRYCTSLDNFNRDQYFKIDVSNIMTERINFQLVLDLSKINQTTSNLSITLKQPTANPKWTLEFCRRFPMYSLSTDGTAVYSKLRRSRYELACSNCERMMAHDIFICAFSKHLVCFECRAWCGLCECPIFDFHEEAARLTQTLSYPCKWNCGMKITDGGIREHEKYCCLNLLKCPECYKTMTVDELEVHLMLDHQSEFYKEFDLLCYSDTCTPTDHNQYFIMNNNLFKIKCIEIEIYSGGSWYTKSWKLNKRRNIMKDEIIWFNIIITPCYNVVGMEMFVIFKNNCHRLKDGMIRFRKDTTPQLYIKYFL